MESSNAVAFKEWAVICAALGEGRQSLILRKGGIHEGRGGFRVEHREFWLFPTYLHQNAHALVPDGQSLLARVLRGKSDNALVRLEYYVVVEEVLEIREERVALALAGQHLWSPRAVAMRFHYKRPGLIALPVRVYRLAQPLELPNSPYFAGCRSWVDLPTAYSSAGVVPVLNDAEFARRLVDIRQAVAPVRLA